MRPLLPIASGYNILQKSIWKVGQVSMDRLPIRAQVSVFYDPHTKDLGPFPGKNKVKQNNHSHRAHVSLLFSGSEDLVTTHLSLSSVASFSWVWWHYGVTPMTFTTVRMVRTAGYRPFNIGSKLWVRILFTYRRSPGWNLWASSDMG